MPTLAGFSGESLVPDIAGAVKSTLSAYTDRQKIVQDQVKNRMAADEDKRMRDMEQRGLLAYQFLQQPDIEKQNDMLLQVARGWSNEGRDLKPLMDIYNLGPNERNAYAQNVLNEYLASQKLIGGAMGIGADQNNFQKGEGALITGEDGKTYFAVPKFNPKDGTIETITSPVGGTLVSKRGLTPQQEAELEADTAYQVAKRKIEAGTATAEEQAYVAKKIKEAETAGSTGAQQAADFVSMGIEAVDNIGTVADALDLLKSVKTGGKQSSAALWVKSNLGIESADEGELSYLLSKNVLQQLRPTFGAAFTKAEGDSMKEIESGIGRSNGTNVRLLTRAMSIYERSARRGLIAAKKNKDDFSAAEIQRGLDNIKKVRAEMKADGGGNPQSGKPAAKQSRVSSAAAGMWGGK